MCSCLSGLGQVTAVGWCCLSRFAVAPEPLTSRAMRPCRSACSMRTETAGDLAAQFLNGGQEKGRAAAAGRWLAGWGVGDHKGCGAWLCQWPVDCFCSSAALPVCFFINFCYALEFAWPQLFSFLHLWPSCWSWHCNQCVSDFNITATVIFISLCQMNWLLLQLKWTVGANSTITM